MSDYEYDYEDDYEAFENDYEDYSYRSRDDRRNERIAMLERQIKQAEEAVAKERNLRGHCPAVQDAWERYQTLLTLARVEE